MPNYDPRTAIDDIDLAAAIAAILHGRAALAPVIVDVSEGVVRLEGTVASRADRKAAETVVRRFAGVRGIRNFLAVQAAAPEDGGSLADRPASE